LILFLSLPSFAVNGAHVKYEGGTTAGVSTGAIGRLDTTSSTSLIFQSAGRKIEIPYDSIESYQYTCEVARRLGFLPTIAVGLLKVRQRRHFLRITYRDGGHNGSAAQVVVFEVPKQMTRTLQPILEARARRSSRNCVPCAYLE
jgi:hypothetical protein